MNTTHIKTILTLIGSTLVLSTSMNVLADVDCSWFADTSLDDATSYLMTNPPPSAVNPSTCETSCQSLADDNSPNTAQCMQNIYNYNSTYYFNTAFSTFYTGDGSVGASNPQGNGSQLGATNPTPPPSTLNTISSTVNHATNSNPSTTTQPNTNTQSPNNQSNQQQTKTNTVRWL